MQVHPAISWLRLIEPAQEKMAYGVLSGLTPRSGFYGCHDMYTVGYSSLCHCKARFLGRYIASVLQGRASNVSPRLWNAALATTWLICFPFDPSFFFCFPISPFMSR